MAFEKLKKIIDGDGDIDNVNEEAFYSVDEGRRDRDNGSQMVLVEPRAYSESQTIADHLKSKNTVVVNLKRVTEAQAKRIIDFLTGTLYAIGGDLQKIGPGIYLCTPNNVNVQGRISEEEEKNIQEDEISW